MKNLLKKIPYIFLGALVASGILSAGFVFANPSYFSTTYATASATTSPNYLTAGAATSTLSFDAYADNTNQKADMASLLIQFAGSSTASVLNVDIQHSDDNVDWYAESLAWNVGENVATSTPNIGVVEQYTFPFASSTISRALVTNANSATSTRIIKVSTPTRYTRAVFTMTGGPGAVWARFVPVKQEQ